MNPFDMLAVVILCFCLIRGLFRGLIKEVSSIIGVLGAYYAAYTYYGAIAKILSSWIADATYLNIISFMIIFIVIFIIISMLGVVIKYLLNIAFLGWVDRICGAGFGLVKGILVVSVILVALTTFLPKGTPVLKKSLLSPYVIKISEKMSKVVSSDMKRQFNDKIGELKKAWQIPG